MNLSLKIKINKTWIIMWNKKKCVDTIFFFYELDELNNIEKKKWKKKINELKFIRIMVERWRKK